MALTQKPAPHSHTGSVWVWVIRIANLVTLLVSYLISLLFRQPILWGKPVFVSIEPTNYCNLRCKECPTGQHGLTRASGMLSFPSFSGYLQQLPASVSYLTLYFQGEPFMNPAFPEMIAAAKKRRIRVWSSTNGHFMTPDAIRKTIEARPDKLIISVDGTTQESYAQYRTGGSLERVLLGIREFVRIKKEMRAKKPKLIIQFLVLKSNEHQISGIRRLGKELGVDKVALKSAQFYDFEKGNPLMPESGKWARYRRTGGRADGRTGGRADGRTGGRADRRTGGRADRRTGGRADGRTSGRADGRTGGWEFAVRNRLRNRCFRMWSGCVITWDGKVVPCCYDKDAGYILGDLNTQSFSEIWNGKAYRDFRRKILQNRKTTPMCRNCGQRW